MQDLRARLEDLESEVGSLRGELRLMKRKFRNIDPYRDTYRQVIENVVSEMLDNQYSWKMVRLDSRVSDAFNSGSRGNYKTVGSKREGQGQTYTFNSLGPEDVDEDSDEGDAGGSGSDQEETYKDPLKLSNNLFSILSDEDEVSDEDNCTNQPINIHSKLRGEATSMNTSHSPAKKHSFKTPNGQHSQRRRGNKSYTQTYTPTTEFKLQACERARAIGPCAAGRELHVPESSIRTWQRRLASVGYQYENTKEATDDSSCSLNPGHPSYAEPMGAALFQRKVHFKGSYKQGYESTPEFKLKVCERSKEVGAVLAGKEFNVPEGSIRSWIKMLPKIELTARHVAKRVDNRSKVRASKPVKRKRTDCPLESFQKEELAAEIAKFPCIWKVDHPQFSRPKASDKAFDIIAENLQLSVNSCRAGWNALKQALKYVMSTKPKLMKAKFGDLDSEGQNYSSEGQPNAALEEWEFYDCMKFYVVQQINKMSRKRRRTDHANLNQPPLDAQDSSLEVTGEDSKSGLNVIIPHSL